VLWLVSPGIWRGLCVFSSRLMVVLKRVSWVACFHVLFSFISGVMVFWLNS